MLNDCLDQIDDFLDGQIEYDDESVVEFLRSNDYNVEETIDFIMDNGCCTSKPIKTPEIPKVEKKPIAVKSSYTLPAS